MSHDFDTKRFDAYMKLVDFRLRRVQVRSSEAWRISIALWGLLAGFAHFYSEKMSLCALIAATLFGVAIYIYCVLSAWIRDDRDIKFTYYYSERAEQLVGEIVAQPKDRPTALPKNPTWRERIEILKQGAGSFFEKLPWTPVTQISMTLLIAACSFWLASAKQAAPATLPL